MNTIIIIIIIIIIIKEEEKNSEKKNYYKSHHILSSNEKRIKPNKNKPRFYLIDLYIKQHKKLQYFRCSRRHGENDDHLVSKFVSEYIPNNNLDKGPKKSFRNLQKIQRK